MVEIIARLVCHAQLLHHTTRFEVRCRGEGHQLFQPQYVEAVADNLSRPFGCEALVPVFRSKSPADLHTWRERSIERGYVQSDEPNEGATASISCFKRMLGMNSIT